MLPYRHMLNRVERSLTPLPGSKTQLGQVAEMKILQDLAFALLGSFVLGAVFFVIGFYGPLLVGLALGYDPNMAPIWGFILGPFGAAAGFVAGWVWSLRERPRWPIPRIALLGFSGAAGVLMVIVIVLQAAAGTGWITLFASVGKLAVLGALFSSGWLLKPAALPITGPQTKKPRGHQPIETVKVLIYSSAFLSALHAPLHAADAPASTKSIRPNILFIYTDDQRWDALGVVQKEQGDKGRFPWLKTPNMDRLAGEGIRFRNAFVVTSLCSPSRANFLTGQYGHRNGVKGNAEDFPVTNVTVASLLTEAGYATGYFGKWHMGEQSGKRPGFNTSVSYVGHGRYVDCPFEVDGVKRPTKGWVDTVTTDFALDFIRQNTNRPFFAMVGFKTPHDNRLPRQEDRVAYANAQSTVPANANSIPPFGQGKSNEPIGTQQPLKPYDQQYFQTLNGADHNLGRLLDALDELGLSEHTIVIYTSDNGYFMGEHTLGDKRFAYEESLRIPLLLRYPKLGLKGKVVDEMVLNIDFAPTALDFAGEPVHSRMQGHSWSPLLEGTTPDWRRSFYYEYFVDSTFPNIPPVQALRTDSAKLIVYPGHEDWTELYDLKHDPLETRNLAKDPASTDLLDRLRAEFIKEQQRAAK